jgi:hypothetical protein
MYFLAKCPRVGPQMCFQVRQDNAITEVLQESSQAASRNLMKQCLIYHRPGRSSGSRVKSNRCVLLPQYCTTGYTRQHQERYFRKDPQHVYRFYHNGTNIAAVLDESFVEVIGFA